MKNIVLSRVLSVLTAIVLLTSFALAGSPALAVATLSSGPVDGGTAVTINGIHFVKIAGGRKHTLGLTSEGTVFAWGLNSSGQLGVGSTVSSLTPVQVLAGAQGLGFLTGVTSIDAGNFHSIASTSTGAVFAWGYNSNGQLGNGSTTNQNEPVQVLAGVQGSGYLTGVSSVSAGQAFSTALATSGSAFAWGDNTFGQLGDRTTSQATSPVQIVAGTQGAGMLSGITSLCTGQNHVTALTSSGAVYAWGDNAYGQIGDSTISNIRTSPVQVLAGAQGSGSLSNISSLANGSMHSLAVSTAGEVFAWGYNYYGELGNGQSGNGTDRAIPVRVVAGEQGTGDLYSIVGVSAGWIHSVALTSSGTVFSWGDNTYGQLGNGTNNSSNAPVKVVAGEQGSGNLGSIKSLAGDQYFQSFGVADLGRTYSWGYNSDGQLGDGNTSNQTSPVLGVNFQAGSVSFGTVQATNMSFSGDLWSMTSPAGPQGQVVMSGTANLFAGATVAFPAMVQWNAGAFTYEPALAATGSSNIVPLGLASAGALLCGAVLMVGLRRLQKK
jgi:alpha-tubulin suppressor-like RCC1 family protein